MDADPNFVLFPIFVLRYPLFNAATLIQIGHEPLASYATTNLWEKPIHSLPNVIQYALHVARVDGIVGCYRGFNAVLAYHVIYRTARRNFQDMLSNGTSKLETRLTGASLMRSLLAQTAAILVSQPLLVIALRSIGQFVGHEDRYQGLSGAVSEVYHSGGLAGFFAGLAPIILSELAATCLASLLALAAQTFLPDPGLRDLRLTPLCSKMAGYFALLPLQTVGNTMAVNNCGLAAGLPTYDSWLTCWKHLATTQQLTRANWWFFRSRTSHEYNYLH